jgi:hypothetical protein
MRLVFAGVVVLFAVIALAEEQRRVEHPCIVIPENAMRLPTSVIRAVMSSAEAAFARNYLREQGKDPYRSAPLQGVRIHLSDSGGHAYLVSGTTPMTGADNRWYWLVQESEQKATVLLFVATGCVHIGSETSHGYRNVQTTWEVPGRKVVREYRFDGQTYKLRRERTDTE